MGRRFDRFSQIEVVIFNLLLYLCPEFRRHSGGVSKDFIEKGVIEIINTKHYNYEVFTQFLAGTASVPGSVPVLAHAGCPC